MNVHCTPAGCSTPRNAREPIDNQFVSFVHNFPSDSRRSFSSRVEFVWRVVQATAGLLWPPIAKLHQQTISGRLLARVTCPRQRSGLWRCCSVEQRACQAAAAGVHRPCVSTSAAGAPQLAAPPAGVLSSPRYVAGCTIQALTCQVQLEYLIPSQM